MNIVVVQETDWIRNLPLVSHHIIELLSLRGHNITVFDHPSKRGVPDASIERGASVIRYSKIYHGASVTVRRHRLSDFPKIGRLTTAIGILPTMRAEIGGADMLILYSVPTNGVQSIIMAKAMRKPVLFHVIDALHPLVPYPGLREATFALEGFAYRNVDRIVAVNHALVRYVSRFGVPPDKISTIPVGVDTTRFVPNGEYKTGKVRKELGFSADDFVVLFSGWLYRFCGVDKIVCNINKIASKTDRLNLFIVGEGPLLAVLHKLARGLRNPNVVKILPRQPHFVMPSIISCADLCINPFLEDPASVNAFPAKILEYMACGKPTLASALPGTVEGVGHRHGVEFVSPDRFMDRMIELSHDVTLLAQMGKDARLAAESMYDYRVLADKFEEQLNRTAR